MNIHDIDLTLCDLWDPQENWDLKDLHILLLLISRYSIVYLTIYIVCFHLNAPFVSFDDCVCRGKID